MADVALPVLEETLFPSPRTLLAGLGLEDLDDLRERVAPIGVDWIEIAIDREDDFSDWDDPLEVDFYLESNGTDGEAAVEQLEVVSRHSGVVARAWVGFPNSLSEVRRMVKALSEATSSVALSERGAHWITCLVDEGDAVEELESFLESGVVDASRRLVSVESESDVGLGVPGLRLEVGGWPGAVVVSVPFPINLDNLHAWMSRLSPVFDYPQPFTYGWVKVLHIFPFLEKQANMDAIFLIGGGTLARVSAQEATRQWVEMRLGQCKSQLGPLGLKAVGYDDASAKRELTELMLSMLKATQKQEEGARTVVKAYRQEEPHEAASEVTWPSGGRAGGAMQRPAEIVDLTGSPGRGALAAKLIPVVRVAAVLVSSMLLLGTALVLPYDYYTLLRLVVFVFSCFLLWLFGNPLSQPPESQPSSLVVSGGLAAIAVLFNPIVPVALDRETWTPIDIATAFGLLTVSFLLTRQDGSLGRVRSEA